MFTGIITDIGEVTKIVQEENNDKIYIIKTNYNLDQLNIGDSVCCNGVCLTITNLFPGIIPSSELNNAIKDERDLLNITKPGMKQQYLKAGHGITSFSVQVSDFTISCTNFNKIEIGSKINLELSLKFGDKLSGHLVSGHIDACTKLNKIDQSNGSFRLEFMMPQDLFDFISLKGSIAINGISLTIIESAISHFAVNIIPHSWQNTNLQYLKPGDLVNIEVDILARYLMQFIINEKEQGPNHLDTRKLVANFFNSFIKD